MTKFGTICEDCKRGKGCQRVGITVVGLDFRREVREASELASECGVRVQGGELCEDVGFLMQPCVNKDACYCRYPSWPSIHTMGSNFDPRLVTESRRRPCQPNRGTSATKLLDI